MGVQIYSDGSVYNGVWLDDKRHGQGILTYPNSWFSTKQPLDGLWINDEFIKKIDNK